MFKLNYTTSEYKGNLLYSSKVCFPKGSSEEEAFINEFINIINKEFNSEFKTVSEIVELTGFTLIDELCSILDNMSYGIAGIACDMWSCMIVEHVYYPKKYPCIRIEYDFFIFAFVQAYHLIEIIELSKEGK